MKALQHPLRMAVLVALFASLVLLLGIAACSKSSSPTNPYGGGGGGGGTAGSQFNLGPFAIGQSAVFTFATAGTFPYHCIPHASMGMRGSVQVDAAGADSATVQVAAGGFTFTPATAHIKPGGHVRWVNASNLANHTVTSDQ
jgi:plastocyanin